LLVAKQFVVDVFMSLDVDRGCIKDLLPVESGSWFDTEYSHDMCALSQLLLIRIAWWWPISFRSFCIMG